MLPELQLDAHDQAGHTPHGTGVLTVLTTVVAVSRAG